MSIVQRCDARHPPTEGQQNAGARFSKVGRNRVPRHGDTLPEHLPKQASLASWKKRWIVGQSEQAAAVSVAGVLCHLRTHPGRGFLNA